MKKLNLKKGIEVAGHNFKHNEKILLKIGKNTYLEVVAITKITDGEGAKSQIIKLA